MSRRHTIWLIIALLIVTAAGGILWMTQPLPRLTVTTWPGTYGRAQANAMFHPYGESRRVDVRIAEYDGGLDHVRNEVAARKYDWDVIDFELADAISACREGILAPIDLSSLPAGTNGSVAHNDFVGHALGPCWVGSVVYAQVLAFSPNRFPAEPRSARDFFDLARFPGP